MKTRLTLATLGLLASSAHAQATAQMVPQNHVPPSVVMEVRALDREFGAALSSDCAPERCVSKGCAYADHVTIDLPRTASLPGLGNTEAGPGSVPPQEYLTEAVCQLAYEKSVADRDVRALKHRLEQRLSKAWLKVTVVPELLEPVPAALRESPTPPPPPLPPPAPALDDKAPPPPPVWDASAAVHELWNTLLPHFAWMIALMMVTISALLFIWALRRLGRESVEEKLLASQLTAQEPTTSEKSAVADAALDAEKAIAAADAARDDVFVLEQERLWTERIAQSDPQDAGDALPLFREWLRAGEHDLLAKAVFVFGDHVSKAISADAELAMKKMEFAEYLRDVDEKDLPPPSEFFRRLNHHAVSSLLLSQDDVQIYRSLVEEFGSHGILRLTESLDPRYGALLFALVPFDAQRGAVQIMAPEFRIALADKLLESTRISREEMAYLFDVLRAARKGDELPKPPARNKVVDRGREMDAAGALSVLLSRIDPQDRAALFQRAIARFGGALPQWYENIVFGDMLLKLPDELRNDVLLDVDVRALAGWLSVQDPKWADAFVQGLAPSIRAALSGNRPSSSAREQMQQARRGHAELASALKKQAARGRVALTSLFA